MTGVSMRGASLVVAAALAFPLSVQAGVKTEEKTLVQFGGFMGGLMNRMGGKAAKEGVVATEAVAGDRKLTTNESTGQIVDLAEEKIYDLDLKKKTYSVTTFAELKRKLEEERAKAEQEARKAQEAQKEQEEERPQGALKEYEIDFEVKNPGETKTIAGHDAKHTVLTVTVREKGRKLQQSGGLVLTTDLWLAPRIAALREMEEFDRRYAARMAEIMGVPTDAASAQQMTAMLAMYPGIQKAMEKMKAEQVRLDGTAVLTTLTVTAVKSAAQMAEAQRQQEDTGGGLGGMLARRMMKKKGDPDDPRSMVMTSTTELLQVTPGTGPTDVALPAGYKQK